MILKRRLSTANMSLQMKISLPVLVALLAGLGLFSLVGLQAVQITTNRILDERLNRARIAADLLDGNLEHLLLHLQTTASMFQTVNSPQDFDSLADSLARTLVGAEMPPSNVILADASGKVLQLRRSSPGAAGIDFALYPEVVRILKAGVPAVSNSMVDEAGRQVVLAAAPIAGAGGESTGMIGVTVDISRSTVRAFSQAMRLGDTGYTEVVDGNGVVLIRTQPASSPHTAERSDHPQRFAQLISEGKAAVRTCHRCHESNETIQRKKDVLAFAPLTTAPWGLALRQSEEEALAPTHQLEERLLFLGAIVLVGISLLLWSIMQSVVRPIRALTVATQRVAAGDFRRTVPGKRRDEIGRLNAAFHTMTAELERSREELLSRNRELLVLNSIATSVSQSLDQGLILESALERVLEVSRATSGCVFLAERGTGNLVMKVRVGRASLFNCKESGLTGSGCACYQVMRSGQTQVVNHPSQCPLLQKGGQEATGGFVAVPLKSRARALGVMNVCFPEGDHFTDNDFKLLESIGYYVGLAMENSALYEEARQKEALRGQLLKRLIGAQEDERKRLARELHDEHAQTLTGLIMNMEKMEGMISPQQGPLKEKMEKARTLVSRLLDNIRLLTVGLRPSDLDDLGLVAAISAYAEERLETAGIALQFEAGNFDRSLPPTVETALFRIIQEAVNNVIRHAAAKKVVIQLTVQGERVRAIVEDDGRGFEPGMDQREGSLGLLGIRERVELLGGTFSIYSRPGKGTRLTVEIPVPDAVIARGARENGIAG